MIEKDVSRELQAADAKNRDAFRLLANIYLYATGFEPKRPRMRTNFIVERENPQHGEPLGVARVKTSAGEFDPEPGAMPQLAAFMSARHGINLKTTVCRGSELSKNEVLAF